MEIISRISPLSLLIIATLTCVSSNDLLSCLSSRGVSNVATHNSPSYGEMLNASIANLRFVRSNAPKPFALIFPINADQVSTSIGCSRGASLAIRFRSGGHSYEGLAVTADQPFVIIDMSNLDRVTVDLDAETAWVESGATVGELYYPIGRASNKHAVSAGFWPPIGVGGHFSGGGFGPLARKYGLAVDNMAYDILVDAEGRVLVLLDRKSMGEDVFWGIRGGGGGSWGVVVAWKIQLLRVPEKVTGFQLVRVGTVTEAAER